MKKLFAVILALVLCFVLGIIAMAANPVYYDEGSKLYYEIRNGNVTGASYAAVVQPAGGEPYSGTSYEIPGIISYNGGEYYVMEIADNAFRDSNIQTLTFDSPSSLNSIGDNAFWDCENLTGDIELPTTLSSLSQDAFKGCTDPELDIKVTVINIGLRNIAVNNTYSCLNFVYKTPENAVLSNYGEASWEGATIYGARYKVELFTPESGISPIYTEYTTDTATKNLKFDSGVLKENKYYFKVQLVNQEGENANIYESKPATSNMIDRTVIYSLQYDENGGNGFRPGGQKRVPGDTVTDASANLTKDGNAFSHWNTQADGEGTNYNAGDIITMTENITLYAQYEDVAAGEPSTGHTHGETKFSALSVSGGELAPGNYCLSADTAAAGDITVESGTVTLCLNGYTLDMGSYSITVNRNAVLNVCDCHETAEDWGKITALGEETVLNGGSFSLDKGIIENTNSPFGTGIYNSKGTVNIAAGKVVSTVYGINNYKGEVAVTGGEVNSESSGIYNDGGTLGVSGTAKVTGNTAIGVSGGETNVSGGEVKGNNIGISVMADGSTVNITGGTVQGNVNSNEEQHAGVLNNGGTVNISGGTVKGRSGVCNYKGEVNVKPGANVFGKTGILNKGTVNITGGEVFSTDTSGYANYAGLFNAEGIANISGTAYIHGYLAMYNEEQGKVNITGGRVIGSAAGVYSYGEFNISGGEIAGESCGIKGFNGSITVSGTAKISGIHPDNKNSGNGISVYSGTLKVTGGEIKGSNDAVHNTGTAGIFGGNIIGNCDGKDGGFGINNYGSEAKLYLSC